MVLFGVEDGHEPRQILKYYYYIYCYYYYNYYCYLCKPKLFQTTSACNVTHLQHGRQPTEVRKEQKQHTVEVSHPR